ncbi:hypothetical protein LTR86_007034 [Recurvomyces mirabilis]|nr:hypothetical protein LTR86_007034 [Recurvomyces mirabilis]
MALSKTLACYVSTMDQSSEQPNTPSKKATTPSKKSSRKKEQGTTDSQKKRSSQQENESVRSTFRGSDDPRSPGAAAFPSGKQSSLSSNPPPSPSRLTSPFTNSSRDFASASSTSTTEIAGVDDYDVVEDANSVPYTSSGQRSGNKPFPLASVTQQTSTLSRDPSSEASYEQISHSEATSPYDDDFDTEGHEANQGVGIVKAMGRAKPGDSDDEG